MTLSFFSGRKNRDHKAPHVEPVSVGVNVMATERDGGNDAIPYVRYDAEAAHIGKHLPNAGRGLPTPGMNLKLARAAAVLHRYADYLEGNGPAPDLIELADACRLAADHMRDGVVIA